MTYRDAMAALQQKVEALKEELETLRRDASLDTLAAIERASALELAIQRAHAATQIASFEKHRAEAEAEAERTVLTVQYEERIHALEILLEEERKLHLAVVDVLNERIAELEGKLEAKGTE